ncbi:SPOR domain-containing protein [Cupriavidus sp. AU9028]|uniref:SPOR domain-containing protein n=1 Tax=Cupriavidus sp. AU9028 TaxID=2871157 RepID=UPI001C955C45|nr:SPOR domain-containing protein [Cupriavidus sp. AU9028]MBY4896375.1 SPOR domain-containing protein [Cupriavidus sp. AU9028]
MGLLSLFSSRKGNDAAPGRGRRERAADAGAASARSRRGAQGISDDYPDDTLDPEFPAKQRARRRLIGAVVMTVAAVIVLPIIFETEPRPPSDNIAVKLTATPEQGQRPRPEPRKADPLPPQQPARSDAAALDAGEELVEEPARGGQVQQVADKGDKPGDKPEKSETQAHNGSGKYVILVGAFSTEDKAKSWLGKLKANKVPAYIERKTMADGERILLRAGPFADRDAAEAAQKRVKAAGLTAKVVEL